MSPPPPSHSLDEIPVGHYHRVMESGHPVRRAWHILKFTRVLELLEGTPGALLDVGCFAGSLLSLAPEDRFPRQVGVDILPAQLGFAREHFGTTFREFRHISTLAELATLGERFRFATCVEVIEHLTPDEIRTLVLGVASVLEPGGSFVLSTPNYASTWPLLELALNRFSDVKYEEQHITRFQYFTLRSRLARVVPELPMLFRWDVVTTTHWVSPFLAVAGVDVAVAAGSAFPHRRWPLPFGNLILFRLVRTRTPVP